MKDRTSTRRQRNARRRVLCQVMKRSRATTLWMVKHRKVLLTLLRHGLNWWLTHHGYEPLSLDTALWRALKGENEL